MVLTLAAALFSAPSLAQDRSPAARQTLLDLAYVMGQAHALAYACKPGDQYWRARMERLMALEQPDLAFKVRLTERFNTGFSAMEGQFPTCDAAARAQAARVASRGRDLSLQLSRIR
ncbi:MAG: TIGR02301 family protein [Caulobacteraceae bacterium]|nr:TIGR02301 family protein [Caulobacteraceae bacterium]